MRQVMCFKIYPFSSCLKNKQKYIVQIYFLFLERKDRKMQKLLRKERLPRNKNDKSFKTLRNDIGMEELDLNDLEWNSNNKNDESNEWDLNDRSKYNINVGEKVQKGKHFNFYKEG